MRWRGGRRRPIFSEAETPFQSSPAWSGYPHQAASITNTAADIGGAQALLRLELEAAGAGRYEIVEELGQGGMAVVYLGRDLALDRLVAIKVLPPDLARQPSFRERFLRESRTVASLSHPNIVPVHGAEIRDTIAFFVMGFVKGESLAGRIQRTGPLPSAEVSRMLREIAWALAYAHSRGVVHRDVKPHNILIEHATGRALLSDFGIAWVPGSSLTAPGASMGTPHYMSPEHISGEPVDGRSDLYSLGIVGFQALTGRVPFDADNPQGILAMHLSRPAPPVNQVQPGTPHRLAQAIDRCLAKEPGARFESADALVAALPTPTASHVEVAPPVRNFQRSATMAMSQVFLLIVAVPILAFLRPGAADLLGAVLVFGSLAIIMQLRGRAQLLLATGYSYQDFRTAVTSEQRDRAEEIDAFRTTSGGRPGISHWSFWVALAIGVGLTVLGVRRSVDDLLRRLELIAGLGIAGLALVTEFAGSPLRRRGFESLAAGFWVSPLGSMVFGTLGTAHPLPLSRPTGVATGGHSVASSTWDRLSPAIRRVWEAVNQVTNELDTARAEWLRHEEAIGRALESASWRLSQPMSSGDDTDSTQLGLLERRRQLVAGMEASRDRVRAIRQQAAMALENLRLQTERLRSGLENTDDALRDVAAAKEILASAASMQSW